jgi:DNA-binding MarR family transcriptional regulator
MLDSKQKTPNAIYSAQSYKTEESIGFLLGCCISRITDAIDESLVDLGVRSEQFGVLHAILQGRAKNPSDLRRLRYRSSAAITYTLNALEERKMLVRTRCAQDGRGIELKLTAKGMALTKACIPRMIEAQNRVLECLDLEDFQMLSVLLRRLAVQPST